jgi:uncharacterized protein (DUF433 family)
MDSGVIVVRLVNAVNKQYNVILDVKKDIEELTQEKIREALDLYGHNDSKILTIDVIKGEVI